MNSIRNQNVDSIFYSFKYDKIINKINKIFKLNVYLNSLFINKEQLTIALLTGIFTLIGYFLLFGKRHRRKRKELINELKMAKKKVIELQHQLTLDEQETNHSNSTTNNNKRITIWMDGAFDMMHYGHMNAFRQGKALGTYLIVGVNDDKSITECKGAPPVMNDEERVTAVEGCKFVDGVERHCPYVMNSEYLNKMIKKHNIDYIVHGDDPCIVDGKDVYEEAKKLHKFVTIPRTQGVSTSDILGRLLLLNKSHFIYNQSTTKYKKSNENVNTSQHLASAKKDSAEEMDDDEVFEERSSKFLTTNRILRLFSVGCKDPITGNNNSNKQRIIYVSGAFDMFHCGHIDFLKKAKQYNGDKNNYLIVGIYNDLTVNKYRGLNYPIMNLHERVLSVLGCKYVDDVLIDAPWEITKEMILSLNIDIVLHGKNSNNIKMVEKKNILPIKTNIYFEIDSLYNISVNDIVTRINNNRDKFEKKYKSKMIAENEYYNDKYKKN